MSWAAVAVVLGLVMEYWVIWRENRDEWDAFTLGIVRFADRPSTTKYVVELISVSLITLARIMHEAQPGFGDGAESG